MVTSFTDLSGIVLRTLHTLRPSLARYAWSHGAVLCDHYCTELATKHYNFWRIPWSRREGQPGVLLPDGRRAASYPTILFGCERYLFTLESRYPEAFAAESLAAFVQGLESWDQTCDRQQLIATFNTAWPSER